jgi:formate hydrogenlyase transcriptional activator
MSNSELIGSDLKFRGVAERVNTIASANWTAPIEGETGGDDIFLTSIFEEIVGSSEAICRVTAQVMKVAPSDATVLITGESGTGKELIARAVHRRSNRSRRSFVCMNCAATPPSLIAADLFGHEEGAFTGANQRNSSGG